MNIEKLSNNVTATLMRISVDPEDRFEPDFSPEVFKGVPGWLAAWETNERARNRRLVRHIFESMGPSTISMESLSGTVRNDLRDLLHDMLSANVRLTARVRELEARLRER